VPFMVCQASQSFKAVKVHVISDVKCGSRSDEFWQWCLYSIKFLL
jgi:hypothetical protein